LHTACYRGQRSAWQVGAAVPTSPLSAALGLSCIRLATAGNEALGKWWLPPPYPRSPLRSACLADGSLPRAAKRLADGGSRGIKPWRGPPAALPGQTKLFWAVNRHKREVTDIASGTKSRRGTPAALPGKGVWRHAWCDGAHCPSTARHAANDSIFPIAVPDQAAPEGGLAPPTPPPPNNTQQTQDFSF
jgi:hypothetical protein